jgi:copper chaperone CopZ
MNSMNPKTLLAMVIALFAMTLSAAAAETTVTLSEVHLCCNSCVKGVNTALAPVTGVKAVCDQDASTVVLTASDKETAQKAVNALVAAGYFGKSSDSAIKVENPTGAPDGKVQTLEVTGVHLCCGSCITTVKEVLAKVDGASSSNLKARAKTFTVTGDFDAKKLFEELNRAGLAGRVATAAPTTKPSVN